MPRTLAYIPTPIRIGDLVALFNSEGAWDMDLVINDDGVLEVQSG